MTDRKIAENARSWPFEEARKLVARRGGKTPKKGYALFETGYGPSGLPHIGTFGEVVRTTMVRRAFAEVSDIPARLFVFSDDMDGLRKVPDNIPNRDLVADHLGTPLTAIPDPFGTHGSTPRCATFCTITTRLLKLSCRRLGQSGARPTARSCPFAQRQDASCRRR